jgi:hypothetical protein
MDKQDLVVKFIDRTKMDSAIDTKHIALYLSIIYLCSMARKETIAVNRNELMKLAKISSTATYYRKMAILNESGYVKYNPSQANDVPSTIKLEQL